MTFVSITIRTWPNYHDISWDVIPSFALPAQALSEPCAYADSDNHVVFLPLLADVAGSALNTRAVAAPLRPMLRGVQCRSEEIERIDVEARTLHWMGSRSEEPARRGRGDSPAGRPAAC